jgi:hypothetical protein
VQYVAAAIANKAHKIILRASFRGTIYSLVFGRFSACFETIKSNFISTTPATLTWLTPSVSASSKRPSSLL